jgi:hypothetical protein
VNQFGYSLYTAALQAAVGVRVTGAIAAVVAACGFAHLLVRADARRPVLGAVLGAVIAVGNLVSGRTTFAVGQALGTLALVALAAPRPARAVRLGLAAALAALATWASPVAGLFLGLTGTALVVTGIASRRPSSRDLAPGLVLCVAAAVAVAPMAVLFGNGGRQPYSAESMRINLALAAVAFVAVPGRYRAVRVGAVLTALLLVAAYYLRSPIGSNAMRLPMLYAVPVVAALAELSGRWLAALLAALVWWQSPVMVTDLTRAGSPETRAAYYRPLIAELARRGPVGRVEVVPLRDHWEARYVAAAVPLARGWERQADVERNALFYARTLGADAYGRWLRDGAVEYVAYAPDSVPDTYARQEAALVAGGLPYLREVWRDGTWRLYAVADPAPLVAAPGTLVTSGAAAVTFDVVSRGDVLLRVRYSRWLTLTGGGCLAPGPDGWTLVRDAAPGRHELSSSLSPAGCREPT